MQQLQKSTDSHVATMLAFGFESYSALTETAKREVNKTGREGDYERTFWKQGNWDQGHKWIQYELELVRVEMREP